MATARNIGAAAPGPVTPTRDEAREQAGFEGRIQNETAASVSQADISGDPEAKAFATLRAQAALAGVELQALPEGGYLASRWNLSRELPDLQAVREWLARVGAAQ